MSVSRLIITPPGNIIIRWRVRSYFGPWSFGDTKKEALKAYIFQVFKILLQEKDDISLLYENLYDRNALRKNLREALSLYEAL